MNNFELIICISFFIELSCFYFVFIAKEFFYFKAKNVFVVLIGKNGFFHSSSINLSSGSEMQNKRKGRIEKEEKKDAMCGRYLYLCGNPITKGRQMAAFRTSFFRNKLYVCILSYPLRCLYKNYKSVSHRLSATSWFLVFKLQEEKKKLLLNFYIFLFVRNYAWSIKFLPIFLFGNWSLCFFLSYTSLVCLVDARNCVLILSIT